MNTKIVVVFVSMFLFSGVLPLSLISVDAVTAHHLCPSQSTQEYTASISTGYVDRTLSVFSNETVTLEPTDDTFVRPDYPWQNYGYGDYLWVDSRVTFLKFNLSSIPSYAQTISAELQLSLDENLAGEEIIVGSFLYSNNSWTENDLTWDNVDWNAINSSPSDNATLFYGETWTWKSWNVTYCVRNASGENVSIALKSNFLGSGGLFSSKDRLSGIYSPRLTLNYSVPIHDGTQVGGIIWENTTWTLEGSPYIITETIQIPENITLAIAPSVTVTKPTDGDMFLLHGTIYAHGTVDNKIVFDGGGNSDFFVTEGPGGVNASATLKYCTIRNGYKFWDRWGFFNITHSELANLTSQSYMDIQFSGGVYIEHNIFTNTGGFLVYVAPPSFGPPVYIRHNLFKHATSPIESAGASELIVNYNSFIDIDGIILKLSPGWYDTIISATRNYWGTLDTDVIDSMIYDKNDDINCASFIDYLPILFEPHLDTPKISSTIYVDDDNTAGPWDGTVEHPYQNITQGLNHALKNETIFVYNGTYYENVILNKTVCLIGESREVTIIDARGIGDTLRIEADNVTVSDFTIRHGDNGIYLLGYHGSTIQSNNITKNRLYGISATYSTVNNFERNIISDNDYGIDVAHHCKDNIIQNNTVTNNALGIYLRADDGNNTIQGNILQNNSFGIYVHFSDDNRIIDNTITNNFEYGIYITSSVGNVVYDNLIANSGVAGIYFDGGNDNRIYHNTFIDNSDQVRISLSFNFWDDGYPSGGNWWSDYTDIDQYSGPYQNETGSDGIWDHPYVIDGYNRDNYPVVPEFPAWTSMLLILIVLTVAIVIHKRRLLKTPIR